MDDKLLLNRYRIIAPLAKGGSSEVYKAFDTRMERTVAVKVIPVSARTAVRALREARTVALLNHPNIVTLHEFEEADGHYYLIMEYVAGTNLSDILDRNGRLPVEMALAIAIQICHALDSAHLNDVIHRDIKPSNLRILDDGRVKVMDFGVARLRGSGKTTETTAAGDIVGTFAYMSPEQASGEMVDERSDVFSLGTVLYQMVTGVAPFAADTPAASIFKILNTQPADPGTLNPEVSPLLSQVILKAMAKYPEERYDLATDFRYKLERCRQSSKAPDQVIRQTLPTLEVPEVAAGAGPVTLARRRLRAFWRQYGDTARRVATAVGLTLVATWSNSHLPVLVTSLGIFVPALVFFLSLFLAPAGFAVTLLLISVGLFKLSFPLGLIVTVLAVAYWLTLAQGFPDIAVLPLVSPALAAVNLPFVFPLTAGMIFSPPLAAVLSAIAGIVLALTEALTGARFAWSIAGPPRLWPVRLAQPSDFFGTFRDLVAFFANQPYLLWQIGVWAAVGGIVALAAHRRQAVIRGFSAVGGLALLYIGYLVVPASLDLPASHKQLSAQPATFSLIVVLALLFVFVHPAARPRGSA